MHVFELRLKGNQSRVRAVRWFGKPVCLGVNADKPAIGSGNSNGNFNVEGLEGVYKTQTTNVLSIQAMDLFKALTVQIFSSLSSHGEEETENDAQEEKKTSEDKEIEPAMHFISPIPLLRQRSSSLREHLAGLLFDQEGKLSDLQCHLFAMVLSELQKELEQISSTYGTGLISEKSHSAITDFKDESKSHYPSECDDCYCFELVSILLSLSGSKAGLSFLSSPRVLFVLLRLFPLSTSRVQRSIIDILKRTLPNADPSSLDPYFPGTPATLNAIKSIQMQQRKENRQDESQEEKQIVDAEYKEGEALKSHHKVEECPQTQDEHTTDIEEAEQKVLSGVLAHILLCYAGSLQLQVRGRVNRTVVTHTQAIPTEWKPIILNPAQETQLELNTPQASTSSKSWVDPSIALSLAALVQDHLLVKDVWLKRVQRSIDILLRNLMQLESYTSNFTSCANNPLLWITLASICLVGEKHRHVLATSAEEARKSAQQTSEVQVKRLCENHDDGATVATWRCEHCETDRYLCDDCDHFLHLKPKRRHHQRSPIKIHNKESIKIDIHEGCARARLSWLSVAIDTRQCKAILEFKRDSKSSSHAMSAESHKIDLSRCRFCGESITSENRVISPSSDAFLSVCSSEECLAKLEISCDKILECGHACCGIRNEAECLPCLRCVSDSSNLTQDADDFCMICWSESLGNAPSIKIDCGHVFHYTCIRRVLEMRWNGPRISFGFMGCPLCKVNLKLSIFFSLFLSLLFLFILSLFFLVLSSLLFSLFFIIFFSYFPPYIY